MKKMEKDFWRVSKLLVLLFIKIYMDKTEKILSIIDKLLTLVENKELDEKLDKWVEYMVSEEDEDDLEEGREGVTEHVKDNSPKSLKEENEHLSNLLDSMCELYWASRVIDNWVETILYDPEIVQEVHKVLKKKRN